MPEDAMRPSDDLMPDGFDRDDLAVLASLPRGQLAAVAGFVNKCGFGLAAWLDLATEVDTMTSYWRSRREQCEAQDV